MSFLRNQRESFYDRKYQQTLEAVTEQGAEDALGGDLGGGDEGLGDLGGGDEGLGDLGGGEEEMGGGEETPLLTAPGRREDISEEDEHLSRYEKSDYKRKDGRHDLRKRIGKIQKGGSKHSCARVSPRP